MLYIPKFDLFEEMGSQLLVVKMNIKAANLKMVPFNKDLQRGMGMQGSSLSLQ